MIRILLFISLLFIIPSQSLWAEQRRIIQTNEVVVLFDAPLETVAKEITAAYPRLKSELEGTFRWKLNFRPTILLIKDRKTFQKITGNDFFVAFAVPRQKRIVIDYSKMNRHPFTLDVTLKHELCHLLLHHHIRKATLPKWIDEGISQWASDGISELIMDRKRSVLDEVTLSGNYIRIHALTYRFPRNRLSLLLAYEQSKSLVSYIIDEFGENGMLTILRHLKTGDEADVAIRKALSLSSGELESRWYSHLKKRRTWFVYLATHLYDILFFFAALTAIFGSIKLVIRKRAYKDDDDDEADEDAL